MALTKTGKHDAVAVDVLDVLIHLVSLESPLNMPPLMRFTTLQYIASIMQSSNGQSIRRDLCQKYRLFCSDSQHPRQN